MNNSQYAMVQVSPFQPLKVYLPSKKRLSAKRDYIPISFGHHNKKTKAYITTNQQIQSKHLNFPIRIINHKGAYKIGPLVGILTASGPQGFKGNKKNFKDIIQTGKKTGILVYVFSSEGVDLAKKQVKAYLFLPERNRWISKMMPLPDVIYNRIPSRKEEKKEFVQKTISDLKAENIPFFNPFFFDKWTLHHWLEDSDELRTILPETNLLAEQSLKELIHRYPMLYIKPVNGKAGIGFIKLERKKNEYLLTYQTLHMTYNRTFKSFTGLWNKVKSLTKQKEYIIQQGIHLNKYYDQPYDIRVLIQKNGKGNWKVTGTGIRVAGKESITTHVPQGGHIQSVESVFNHSLGINKTKEWNKKIEELVIKIAKHIEQKEGNLLGEMSMDLGLDENGNLWFFEANAKPMEFDEPSIRETSLLRLMQYFRYLSGFIPKEVIS